MTQLLAPGADPTSLSKAIRHRARVSSILTSAASQGVSARQRASASVGLSLRPAVVATRVPPTPGTDLMTRSSALMRNDRFCSAQRNAEVGHPLNIAVLVLPGFSRSCTSRLYQAVAHRERLSEEATVSMEGRWDGWSACHRREWAFPFGRDDHRDVECLLGKSRDQSTCDRGWRAYREATHATPERLYANHRLQACNVRRTALRFEPTNRSVRVRIRGREREPCCAIRVMEENIEFPLSMTELSQRIGLSRRQLERVFVTHIGNTPAKHYLKLRVDRAKRLIECTRLPLVDIAMASGFVSVPHFSKCFRMIHRISPRQLRLTLPAWVGRGIG